MANKERGEFTLKAGEKTYTLRLTTNACAELEDLAAGRTWDQVLAGINRGSVKDVRLLLWACLREHHQDLATLKPESLNEVGLLIDGAGGLQGVLEQMRTFMQLNADGADEEPKGKGKAARPPKAQIDGIGSGTTPTPSPSV